MLPQGHRFGNAQFGEQCDSTKARHVLAAAGGGAG
jgi:hypothetical protein